MVPFLFGCAAVPPSSPGTSSSPAGTSAVAPTGTASPTGPVPLPACARASGWSDWPGGLRMRLDGGSPVTGEPLDLTVTGAEPGERVVLHVGAPCALDCPAEFDGACFQPADALVLADAVADAAGTVFATVVPDAAWPSGWLVLQATAPDAAAPYLSQAVVDALDGLGDGQWFVGGRLDWISPLTLRVPETGGSLLGWRVGPGRRVVMDYVQEIPEDDGSVGWATVESTVTEVLAGPGTFEAWAPPPAGFVADLWFGGYTLDVRLEPLDAAVDWYPDADGDGYGDPLGPPVRSAVPVAAASPDARDCDDTAPDVHPLGLERCSDGVDQSCDGLDRPCAVDPGVTLAGSAGSRLTGATADYVGGWLAWGDLDADGTGDLAAGARDGSYGSARIWPLDRADHEAGTGFGWTIEGAVGDLTGDGVDDLAVVRFLDEIEVLAGPMTPDGAVPLPVATIPSAGTPLLEAGDVSGDGVADLLVVPRTVVAPPELYLGPLSGSPGSSDVVVPATVDGLSRLAGTLADADGDGLADLWTHEVCLYLAPLPAAGALPAGCADDGTDDNLAWGGLAAGDADGDGRADLAVGHIDAVYVLLGPLVGPSSIAAATRTTVTAADGSDPASVALVPDQDGDGTGELAVAWPYGTWLGRATAGALGDADGVLVSDWPNSRSFSPGSSLLLGGDFDRDGAGDLVLGHPPADHATEKDAGAAWVLWGS